MLTSEISDPNLILMLSGSEIFEHFNPRISDSNMLTSEISDLTYILMLSESDVFEHFNRRISG